MLSRETTTSSCRLVAGRQIPRVREQAASRVRSGQQLGLYVIDAAPGGNAVPRQLTTFEGRTTLRTRSRPAWVRRTLHRPTSRRAAQLVYTPFRARRRAAAGGRPASSPRRSTATRPFPCGHPTGRRLLPAGRRPDHRLARRASGRGTIERIVFGPRVLTAFTGAGASSPCSRPRRSSPPKCSLRMARRCGAYVRTTRGYPRVKLGAVEPISFRPDGTAINGLW